MQQMTAKVTNGWADPATFAVHPIWPWDNHEVVHVITALFGRPSDFFNEGIAVAMSVDRRTGGGSRQSQPSHTWARTFRSHGEPPRPSDIVETDAFRRLDDA